MLWFIALLVRIARTSTTARTNNPLAPALLLTARTMLLVRVKLLLSPCPQRCMRVTNTARARLPLLAPLPDSIRSRAALRVRPLVIVALMVNRRVSVCARDRVLVASMAPMTIRLRAAAALMDASTASEVLMLRIRLVVRLMTTLPDTLLPIWRVLLPIRVTFGVLLLVKTMLRESVSVRARSIETLLLPGSRRVSVTARGILAVTVAVLAGRDRVRAAIRVRLLIGLVLILSVRSAMRARSTLLILLLDALRSRGALTARISRLVAVSRILIVRLRLLRRSTLAANDVLAFTR